MSQDHPSPPLPDIARILAGAGIFVFAQDLQLRYLWGENPPVEWNAGDIRGKTDFDILPEIAATVLQTAKQAALTSGRADWAELTLGVDEDARRFDIHLWPDTDSHGRVTRLLGLAIDVTDRHPPAASHEALVRDSVHRSKNLLAMVQSVATQTARSAPFPDEFVEDFRGRIQVISRSLDLQATPGGVRLSDIVAAEVEAHVDPGRVTLTGGSFVLSANAALHVGLALHELCAAATRSGAPIRISADRIPAIDGQADSPLCIGWHEGEASATTDLHTFSRVLLERIAPAAVGGKAAFTVSEAGRSYELIIAPNEFD